MSAPERWILVSNCQTYGLAHSLQMLASDVVVTPVDVGQYAQDLDRYNAAFADYDRVLAGDSARNLPGADFSRARRLDKTPELAFSAYQPDMTYVVRGDAFVRGPLDVYHSALGFAAHRRGLSVEQALPLFRGEVYAACGHLDRWAPARDGLVAYCASMDLDVSSAVRRWGRERAFMYSSNHPRIHVLFDVARLILEREGRSAHVTDLSPHDNLANGGVYPVYPEVGEALGVPGAYLFKRGDSYSLIDLRRFLEECWAAYDAHPPGALAVHEVFRPDFERVAEVVDAAA